MNIETINKDEVIEAINKIKNSKATTQDNVKKEILSYGKKWKLNFNLVNQESLVYWINSERLGSRGSNTGFQKRK